MSDLNRRAAELVMGWKMIDSGRGYPNYWEGATTIDGEPILEDEWSPTTRWDHAGTLIEKLQAGGWLINMTKPADEYEVAVYRTDDLGCWTRYGTAYGQCITPLGITAAAVAAMEGRDE